MGVLQVFFCLFNVFRTIKTNKISINIKQISLRITQFKNKLQENKENKHCKHRSLYSSIEKFNHPYNFVVFRGILQICAHMTPLISDSNNLQVGKCIMYVDTTGQIKVSSLQWKGDKCVFLFLLQEFQEYDYHYFCLQVLVLPTKNKKNRFFSQKQVQVIMLFPIFYSPVHYKKRTPEFVLKISIYEFVTLIRGL